MAGRTSAMNPFGLLFAVLLPSRCWVQYSIGSSTSYSIIKSSQSSTVSSSIVLATGPGSPPAVRVLTGGSVQFGSRTGQKPDPRCLGGFVTRTGHKPAVFWPGWNRTVVPFCGSYYFGHTLAPIKYLSFDRIVT